MAERVDLVVQDATVYDGSGDPPWRADVAVSGDRIDDVGDEPRR
ncbi:MAG: hypothetical protein U5R31_01950 [Acidimicrobiia bacterium]|nr:hypothetical protein [Acidimicrobiia bacterium]